MSGAPRTAASTDGGRSRLDDATRIDVETCAVCGASRFTSMFRDDPYDVRRCQDCSFVWVSPRYDDQALADVYDDGYWQSDSPKTRGYADYASEAPLYLRTFRRRMAHVRRFLPDGRPARVLDVGCAAGYFLRVMAEHGHDVHGVEPSVIAAEARRHLGAERVHDGLLGDVLEGRAPFEGPFDLVTMWDVIEHVPDPCALLRQARRLLTPEGRLLLETQNVDSRFARWLGPKWHHFKHQEHIYHFNWATVTRVLEQAGFEVEHRTASYGGKYVSLAFVAERAERLHPWLGKLLSPLGRARSASVYVNLRDEMVVTARPRAGRSDDHASSTTSPPPAVHA